MNKMLIVMELLCMNAIESHTSWCAGGVVVITVATGAQWAWRAHLGQIRGMAWGDRVGDGKGVLITVGGGDRTYKLWDPLAGMYHMMMMMMMMLMMMLMMIIRKQ